MSFQQNWKRVLLAVGLAASFVVAAHAVPAVKLPLDMPARTDPKALTNRAVGVAAIDRGAGAYIAVGSWGRILVTRDGGQHWTQSPVPVSSDLVAVNFPTPQQGWAVGHDGVVLHSGDGGKSWVKQLDGRQYGDIMVSHYEKLASGADPETPHGARLARSLEDAQRFKQDGADKPFLDVWFENERSGWIVGAFGLILKTDDGGKHWAPWFDRTENENGYSMYAMGMVGDDIFIVGELGLVLRLDRKENRFVKVPTPYPGSFFGLAGKRGALIVFGLRGTALRSRDDGKTWETLPTGTQAGITGGTFLDDGRLVLIGSVGQILISSDDGDSFTQAALIPSTLNGITSMGGGKVLIASEGGVLTQTLK